MVFADLKREYGAEQRAKGKVEGETATLARTILALLAARGISVNSEARAHIEACRDVATLDRWTLRAATATSVAEVLQAPLDPA